MGRRGRGNASVGARRAVPLLHRHIDATGRQTDQLVYELYDLTDEEAAPGVPYAIVEEASN